MADVMFSGPAGRIQGKCLSTKNVRSPIALLLPNSTIFEATMDQALVYQIYNILHHHGYHVLRINYRGVGKSTGCFDHGEGELEDAAAALDWMQSAHPLAPSALVFGYSFGAYIAAQLMSRRPEVKEFVLVAPPAAHYDFSSVSTEFVHARGLVIAAEEDGIAPIADVESLVARLNANRQLAEFGLIDGSNHFFDQKLTPLVGSIVGWLGRLQPVPGS